MEARMEARNLEWKHEKFEMTAANDKLTARVRELEIDVLVLVGSVSTREGVAVKRRGRG
jgi:hypothetical protein